MDFLRTYFYQNEPLTGMLQAWGGGGGTPPRFWQNRRRLQAAAARHITTCPLDFQTLQHPCLIS